MPATAGERRIECAVKTRYRQSDLACTVRPSAHDDAGDATWRVTLSEPARAVTPGQYAVFYSGERCLGGGVIARRFNSAPARLPHAESPIILIFPWRGHDG